MFSWRLFFKICSASNSRVLIIALINCAILFKSLGGKGGIQIEDGLWQGPLKLFCKVRSRYDYSQYSFCWSNIRYFWIESHVSFNLACHFQRNILKSPKLFAEKFNIPVSDLIGCCNGDLKLFHNFDQAERDAKDVNFMTGDEKLYERCRALSIAKGNKRAIENFDKQETFFGRFRFCCNKGAHVHGLFNNYRSYRIWSRWASVLYLSSIPEMDKDIFWGRTSGLQKELEDEVATFMDDYGSIRMETSDFKLRKSCKDVLSMKYVGRSVSFMFWNRNSIWYVLYKCMHYFSRKHGRWHFQFYLNLPHLTLPN